MDTITVMLDPGVSTRVAPSDVHPSANRVTVKCECRCGRVLGRYTGGLRLTARHPAKREVRLDGGVFVFQCANPSCKVPVRLWQYDRLAVELRQAWDQGRRRFVVN